MMRPLIRFVAFVFPPAAVLAACASGGGPLPPQTPTALPASATILVGESRDFSLAAGGIVVNFEIPPAIAGNGSVTVTASSTPPLASSALATGVSTVTAPGTPLLYLTLTTNDTATYASFPTPGFDLPFAPPADESFYLNYTSPNYSILTVAGPVTAIGGSDVYFSQQSFGAIFVPTVVGSAPAPVLPLVLTAGNAYTFALVEVAPSS